MVTSVGAEFQTDSFLPLFICPIYVVKTTQVGKSENILGQIQMLVRARSHRCHQEGL